MHSTFPLCLLVLLSGTAVAQDFGRLRRALPVRGIEGTSDAHVIVDLDEDGDPDVLRFDSGLALLQNDGRGKFQRIQLYSLPASNGAASTLEVSEFDGAAGLDIVLRQDGLIRLFTRQVDGSYLEQAGAFPTAATGIFGAALSISSGDIDGDGDTDLAMAGAPFDDLLLENDGLGFFNEVPTANFVPLSSIDVYLADFDGDGSVDLFAEEMFFNDGSGSMTADPAANVPGAPFELVDVLDLDGNGTLDFITADTQAPYNNGVPYFHSNDGNGIFESGQYLAGGARPSFLDWDDDGDLDIIAVHPDSINFPALPGIRLWRNNGALRYTMESRPDLSSIPFWFQFFLSADWDQDGDTDAFAAPFPLASHEAAHIAPLWNEGNQLSLGLPNPESFVDGLEDVRLADLDGDGDLDVVGSSTGVTRELAWHRNDGLGRFELQPPLPSTTNIGGYGLPDVDGDGDLDPVGAFSTAPHLRIWRNLGEGNFTMEALPDFGLTGIRREATFHVAELNGVAGDDVVVLAQKQTSLKIPRLLYSDGSGNFLDATPNLAFPQRVRQLALGDTDGDGDTDLLLTHKVLPDLVAEGFLNHGGVFQTTGARFILPTNHSAAALVDMDGDGQLDLINPGLDLVEIRRGSGDGEFETLPTASLPIQRSPIAFPISATTGLPNILAGAATGTPQRPRLYRNMGNFTFADVSSSLERQTDPDSNGLVGDLDRDGDADIWFSGLNEVHWGLEQHLAARHVPAIGRPLFLDIYGPQNGAYVLGLSLGTTSVNTAWGLFHLGASTLSLVRSGSLDAKGRAFTSFEIPLDPAFVGDEVFWQAIVGAPFRLTNTEVTHFADE